MKSLVVRKKIIKTASKLFYQQGYNLTGINEIILKANIAKATLYNHFGSKDTLCLAYIKYQNALFVTKVENFIEKTTEENKIIALFNFLLNYFDTKNFNGCCCVNLVSELTKEQQNIKETIKIQKQEQLKMVRKIINNTYISNTEKENKIIADKVFLLFESALVNSHLLQKKEAIFLAKEMCSSFI